LRLPNQEFYQWKRQQNSHLLFFDGASTGNPGATGAGGVVFDSEGNKVMDFAWGLGKATNNHAEVLAVFMGLHLIPANRSSRLTVIGDSDLITRGLRQNLKTTHPNISRTLLRIRDMEHKFGKVSYYHVYRSQNTIADSLAKEAKHFLPGTKARLHIQL
jgi:ribonuclease HI